MIRGGAFGLTVVFLLAAFVHSQETCSKTCIAQNCNNLGIQYGRYCGIGYTGCPGETPCDDLDACCMTHDNCVDVKGMTYVKCHNQFKRCVNKVSRSIKQSKGQKIGFSKECPYSAVIPTMYNGMNYGIFFSQIGNIVKPPVLGNVLKPPVLGNILKPPVLENVPIVEVDLGQTKVDTKDGLGTTDQLHVTKDGSKVYASLNMTTPSTS